MSYSRIAGLATVLLTCALTLSAAPAPAKSRPVAVVELFTSEGCSSCPPADALLGDLSKDNRPGLFPLAFHVDYWDRLGWADPFADAAFTARQNRYATAFGANQVYTPQMVVNGTAEFVGSDRVRAAAEIKAALARPAAATVGFTAKLDGRQITVDYDAKAPAGSVLNLAAAERGLVTKVRRGENAGKTLRHENVVRAFGIAAIPAGGKGHLKIDLPAGAAPANVTVVAYVQTRETMAVIGAAAQPLKP